MTALGPRRLRVVGAVIRHNDLVLACRRAPGRQQAGLWEFPGGKVRPGEDDAAALIREIGEELGVGVAIGRLIGRGQDRSRAPADGVTIDLHCYEARLLGPPPTISTDHDQLRWLTPPDLLSLDWCPADWPVVHQLHAATQ